MKIITSTIFLTVAFAACAQTAPIPSMTLLPSSAAANPGSAVGFGFTLTYSAPADFVVLTGSQFTGSPLYGTYVDYLSLANSPLYVAGPSPEQSIVTQAFQRSGNPPLGLGEFDISSTAPGGISIKGNILVHYSIFSQDPNDPNFNPDTATVVADATLSQPVAFSVSPEPASLLMLSAGLLPLALIGWRRKGRSMPLCSKACELCPASSE